MYQDKQGEFSAAQAITGDAVSTNVVDTGAVGPGDNEAGEYDVVVQVIQAFNTLTSLTVSLQTATDAAFTTPVTLKSETKALAALTAGARFMGLNDVPDGALRFLRLNYDVTGTDPTEGTITARVTVNRQTQ